MGSIHIWARREETRLQCASKEWCDQCFESIEEAVKAADIIWICAPVGSIAQLVGRIAPHLKPMAIVSDVGSTKSKLVAQCEKALGDYGRFVGSHPMAGSEKSGTAFADRELYTGKPCFVTPAATSQADAVKVIETFWKDLGMTVHRVTPQEHDHIVACISHLPHLVASALAAKVAEMGGQDWNPFVSSGLLDTTRVAAGSVPMWMDIVDHNRDEILPVIREMIEALEHLRSHLHAGQYNAVEQILERGRSFRESLDDGSRECSQ